MEYKKAMLEKIENHLSEFIVVAVILSGLLYSATTSYKNSVKIEYNEKKFKK